MQLKVVGEAPFQVLATNFVLGPSNEGFTLQVSADGVNFSNLFSVGANVTKMVTAVASGAFYRCLGNNSEIIVNWRKQCSDGQGGGGSEYNLPTAGVGDNGILGGVKVDGDTITINENGVISAEGGSASSDILLPLNELPSTAEEGEVRALHTDEHIGEGWMAAEKVLIFRINLDSLAEEGDHFELRFNSGAQAEINNLGGNWYFLYDDINYSISEFTEWRDLGGDEDVRAFTNGNFFFITINTDSWGYLEPYSSTIDDSITYTLKENDFRANFGEMSFDLIDTNYPSTGVWAVVDMENHIVIGAWDWEEDPEDGKWKPSSSWSESVEGTYVEFSEDGYAYAHITTFVSYVGGDMEVYGEVVVPAENKVFQRKDGNWSEIGGDAELPVASEDTLGGVKVGDNLYMDGDRLCANGGGDDTILAPSEYLPEEGTYGDIRSWNGKEWMFKANPSWGKWVGLYDQGVSEGLRNGVECKLVYDYLPSSLQETKLAEYRYYGGQFGTSLYLYFDLENDRIVAYTDDAKSDVFDTVSYGESKNWAFGIGNGKFEWNENYFRFYEANYNMPFNVCDTHIDEGWELINSDEVQVSSGFAKGIPIWDSEGRVIGKGYDMNTRGIFFNNNGYSQRMVFFGDGSYNPERIFVPTHSGNEGQILESAGDGEPIWINKSAVTNGVSFWKGTSDEYDAIETKNPSCLYIIVDE